MHMYRLNVTLSLIFFTIYFRKTSCFLIKDFQVAGKVVKVLHVQGNNFIMLRANIFSMMQET